MVEDMVRFFKALGNETRLRILGHLLEQEHCVCDFETKVDKDQTTISRHLKILVEAGILEKERDGRYVVYKIRNGDLKETLRTLGVDRVESCC
ncbi:metalloregulator ArsR/SmtB family transcription factor [Methanonatronarchaeum sp. AMET-Sl]|uniref:ArsR/SmtB family transcription factor n=1 Tax=Methanonatronarchaeum sp. AMET-Sl TaxID=3037654 RepID=UPI00244E37D7|nr:metalloregulator ArsR/SmtB family transcription factor [Methanonatronarchaeum sp. AMET-Sl]WGI18110.1 metalloregulator ArsR/SmtB family transcription factor [Methanonatronarchaeum sp. AMET-Sl]